MKVVNLAGGLGSRLAEETTLRPKPLVEIGEKPILWHIMNIYSHHGLTDFIICAGYKSYMIKEYFVNLVLHHSDVTLELAENRIEYHQRARPPWRVTVVDTGVNSMTGGRIKRIRDYLDPHEPFCMTYGDGVADIDIREEIAFHRSHGLKATMCAVVPPGRFGAATIEGHLVTTFAEKPKLEDQPINALVRDRELAAYRHNGFWQPMHALRDGMPLEELWNSERAPWKLWN
ncbi:glucose-1-phosphate cytidylyltransferase (plasmid) [Peteryoungia desertarenae]|uniref:Glucose-1-phosphate cytidylyltransferase n=1 Tax=Peteryoungia desertarenae TaxID=1813451 RepID=A0ABX6QTF1_9HYPH|nr:glucose-1-phosphate cytidylyltransferase [Peteryoungia desertarenae]QLF71759.1 glucose-1-phosphate cytidylyltransferase [Peteryoungia desertarenae]